MNPCDGRGLVGTAAGGIVVLYRGVWLLVERKVLSCLEKLNGSCYQEVPAMDDKQRESIAEKQRSPASEAAEEVEIGPSATNREDEARPEPPGTAEGSQPKTGPDGKPIIPPSRGTSH